MHTIEQEIESLAKTRWPTADRIDIEPAMSHVWPGDIEPPYGGLAIRVGTRMGDFVKRLQADTLDRLKTKVRWSKDETTELT